MTKSLLCISETRTVAGNSTNYYTWGTGRLRENTTETLRQRIVRQAGRISMLSVRIQSDSVDGAVTVTVRKNGQPTAMKCTIPQNGANTIFINTTDYIDVVSGDLIDYEVVAGGTTGTCSIPSIGTIFDPTAVAAGTCFTCLQCSGIGGALGTASATRFNMAFGDVNLTAATEADQKIRIYTAGIMQNGGAYISGNTRTTDTVFTLRVNGANTALTFTVPGGATTAQWYEDLTHQVTINSGDEVNWQVVTGSGAGTITVEVFALDFVTTNNKFLIGTSFSSGVSVNFNTTTFSGFGGLGFNTTAISRAILNQMLIRISGFYALIATNTIATSASSLTVSNKGVDTPITASVPPGDPANSVYTNTTNVIDMTKDDAVIFKVATPNTSGALTIKSMIVVAEVLPTTGNVAAMGSAMPNLAGMSKGGTRQTAGMSLPFAN